MISDDTLPQYLLTQHLVPIPGPLQPKPGGRRVPGPSRGDGRWIAGGPRAVH